LRSCWKMAWRKKLISLNQVFEIKERRLGSNCLCWKGFTQYYEAINADTNTTKINWIVMIVAYDSFAIPCLPHSCVICFEFLYIAAASKCFLLFFLISFQHIFCILAKSLWSFICFSTLLTGKHGATTLICMILIF
jgi:hypothetical protein